MRTSLLLSLMALSFATASAQHQLLRRTVPDGILRIDPRGELPQFINDPLPFVKRTPRPCVIDDEMPAVYYFADETGNWSFDHLELRHRNPVNGELTTSLINASNPSGFEKTICSFDSLGRMTTALTYRFIDSSWVPASRHLLEYTGWLLKSDIESEYFNGEWKTFRAMNNEIQTDGIGNPRCIISRSVDHGIPSTINMYDLEYREGKLKAITVSSIGAEKGDTVPFFHCDSIVCGKQFWDISSYSSYEWENNQWVMTRKDARFQEDNSKWEFIGTSNVKGNKSVEIENVMDFDRHGNLTRFIQRQTEQGVTDYDTTGDIRIVVDYTSGTSQPEEIITSYRENGTYHPSVKMILGSDASRVNDNSSLEIYPNPASQHTVLHWTSPIAGSGLLEITDDGGRTVLSSKINTLSSGIYPLEIGALRDGVYTIRLGCANQKWIGRLVVVN